MGSVLATASVRASAPDWVSALAIQWEMASGKASAPDWVST
jgi:hypothetical protein